MTNTEPIRITSPETGSGTAVPPATGSAVPPGPAPTTRRKRWPYAVAAVGVLGAAYVALAAMQGSKLPANTTIGGVQVGGMAKEDALGALRSGLSDKVAAPIPVKLGDKTVDIDPAKAGLVADYNASIDGLIGFTLNPRDLLDQVRGGAHRDVTRLVDPTLLSAALTSAAQTADVEPKNATMSFANARMNLSKGVNGATVDVPGTSSAITAGWLKTSPIVGKMTTVEPDVTDAEITKVKSEVADKILAGTVAIKVGDKTFDIGGEALSDMVSFPAKDGLPVATYNEKKLLAAVRYAGLKAGVLTKAKDAEVTSTGTSFKVTPSVDGLDVDPASTMTAVPAAVLSPERVAEVKTVATPAKFTTDDAKKSIPKGVISTFTTQFPNNPDRTHNITIAAAKLNGVYVAPGEQFSLNGLLGQRTAAKGYRAAPVIMDGRLEMDYGGGISQVSTTLFNAVFFSGAQIDEYHPHSFYISRYPEGREATISWPDVDQKFTNTTGAGIYITTKVTSNAITVTFSGQKKYDIEASKGPRVNGIAPKTIHDDKPGCVPQTPSEGFTVTVERIFKQHGKIVKRSPFTTNYIPEDLVICG